MIIEIHGAGFQNKGAELMLNAAAYELRQRISPLELAIDPTYGPYNSRCGLNLHNIMPFRSHVGTPSFNKYFMRQKCFSYMGGGKLFSALGMPISLYGGVKLSDIEGFVDVSGFAYTDEWRGGRPVRDFASLTSYYKSKDTPVILLPQSFGPFLTLSTRTAFRKIMSNSSLVFARDHQSYDYALELFEGDGKLSIAPDITLFYPGAAPANVEATADTHYACVVPNIRILDKGKTPWGERYYSCLHSIIKELLHRGLQVRVVVHDSTGEDLQISSRLCEESSSPGVSLVQEENPVALKHIISQSFLVAGSRYHSLVAALSQGVPALAIGWSHKYDMLFREFGLGNFVFSSPETPLPEVLQRVIELAEPDINTSYRSQICSHLKEIFLVNRKMWSMVGDTLSAHSA
jgi:colanic acid/amylovoran biosynthesis protein